MNLSDRVILTSASNIRGFVRQTDNGGYLFTLKRFNEDDPPEIIASERCRTADDAFMRGYTRIREMGLRIES